MTSKKRDLTLDYLRGFGIIQMVLIHILYWMHFYDSGIPSFVKSFLLFEMPIIFFVTGAVNGMAPVTSYRSFCSKRVKGLLIPYYVYAVICILLSLLYHYRNIGPDFPDPGEMIVSWLIPMKTPHTDIPFIPLGAWFILTYVIDMSLFPALRAAASKYGVKALYGLILFLFLYEGIGSLLNFDTLSDVLLIDCTAVQDVLQKALFYLIFLCLGIFYPKIKERNKKNTRLALAVLVVSVICMVIFGLLPGRTIDMQYNKFPPNHIFLFFCFAALCVVYLSAPAVRLLFRRLGKISEIVKKMILVFSRQSLYVYLYQSFCFYLLSRLFFKIQLRIELKNETLRFVLFVFALYPMIMLTVIIIEKLLRIYHEARKRLTGAFVEKRKG